MVWLELSVCITSCSIVYPLIIYKLLQIKRSDNIVIVAFLPVIVLLAWGIKFSNAKNNFLFGGTVLFALALLITGWIFHRSNKVLFKVENVVFLICLFIFSIYIFQQIEFKKVVSPFWNFESCKWIGKSIHGDILHLMQYKLAPFAWMLHRFGIIPTGMIFLGYIIALRFYARQSSLTKSIAIMVGVHLCLTVVYSLCPNLYWLSDNLRVIVPFLSYGKTSFLLGIIILLIPKLDNQ